MKSKNRIGPKKYNIYSCKGCQFCKDEYDISEHWVELRCTHEKVDQNNNLIGYLDESFPFPKNFDCPINGHRWNNELPIRRA